MRQIKKIFKRKIKRYLKLKDQLDRGFTNIKIEIKILHEKNNNILGVLKMCGNLNYKNQSFTFVLLLYGLYIWSPAFNIIEMQIILNETINVLCFV